MLHYFLFPLYLLVLAWGLPRIAFVKKSGLSANLVAGLFLLKVLAGLALGWLSLHYYGAGNDYWDLNREGWKEYQLLWQHPGEYFSNIFHSGYEKGYGGVFDSFQSFWNDLRNNIIIKLLSLFNIFSRGNYYINSLFCNFLVFFGHVALFRVFQQIFARRRIAGIIGCFLLPSVLYFNSGTNRDGFVFLLVAALVYLFYFSIEEKHYGLQRLLAIVLFSGLLFLLRNYVLLALVPALAAWWLVRRKGWKPLLVFGAVYLFSGLILFNIDSVYPALQPLTVIVQKQTDYLHLPASATHVPLSPLQPTFGSFAQNAPEALAHVYLRPYFFEWGQAALIPFALEWLLYLGLFVLFVFFRDREAGAGKKTFLWFCLFFTAGIFLFIGYITPNLGSIIRYRSAYLPLLVTPLLCITDWSKLKRLIKIK